IDWRKDQAFFVRNDRYWGQKTYLDKVAFVPRPVSDDAASMAAGDVDVIYQPRADQPDAARTLRGVARIGAVAGPSDWVDALWFNLDDPVLRNPTIRDAFAYAMDRGAVASGVAGLIQPDAAPNDCGPWSPGRGPWCPSVGPFAVPYAYDPDMA